jgi:hypothetical protein
MEVGKGQLRQRAAARDPNDDDTSCHSRGAFG